MKLVTECIANILNSLLPNIVDKEQSAFVQGCLITNNGLISMEWFHWPKKKTKGNKGNIALKLDMSKAYDKIEWDFVKIMMTSMVFPTSLIYVIMRYVTTISYGILINGKPSRRLFPWRALKQWDLMPLTSCSYMQMCYLYFFPRKWNITPSMGLRWLEDIQPYPISYSWMTTSSLLEPTNRKLK